MLTPVIAPCVRGHDGASDVRHRRAELRRATPNPRVEAPLPGKPCIDDRRSCVRSAARQRRRMAPLLWLFLLLLAPMRLPAQSVAGRVVSNRD